MNFLGELRVEASITSLSTISFFLQSIGQRLNLTERVLFEFELAVEEAAVNIIQHAYQDQQAGDLVVRAVQHEDNLTFTLMDWGVPFDPANIPPFDPNDPIESRISGGMGLRIIHSLMDSVRREVGPGAGDPNVLHLTRQIDTLPPGVQLPSIQRELNAMLSVSQAMSAGTRIDDLLTGIIDRLVETLNAEGGTLFLIDEERGELFSRILVENSRTLEEIRVKIGEGIAGHVAATGQTLNIGDAYQDSRFMRTFDQMTGHASQSILAAPMRNPQQKIIGVVELINKRGGEFTLRDERLLNAIAAQAAVNIENARLYAQEMRQQLINKDLETASRIQQSFLPQTVPQPPGWEIAAFWHPMREVGGDFYDFYQLPDERLAIAIADVTDKGVPAALFMSLSVTVLRFAMALNFSPGEMMSRANHFMLSNQRSSMFTTAFVAYLDWETGRIQYASAGHNPPILYRSATKRCHYLKAAGVALGVFKDVTFDEKTVMLEAGDVLVLYTDGVTEIVNPAEEEFGEARLEHIILNGIGLSAQALGQRIMDANDAFAEGLGDFDDETLIVIRRL